MNNNTKRLMCTVDGCNNKHLSKGYCSKHYARLRRYGNVNTVKQEKGVYDSCNVNGCENKHFCKGYCSIHYKRWKRNGNPEKIILNRNHNGKCEVEGCNESYYAKRYCVKHYGRWKTHGDPLKVISRKKVGNCKVTECKNDIYVQGYCIKHYQRLLRNGDPLKTYVNMDHDGECSIKDCDGKYHSDGLCKKHYDRSYKKSERGKKIRRFHQTKRRAMKANAPINDFTRVQWKECLGYFEDCCAYCGKKEEILHQEHVIPISRNGSHTKSNIIPSCGTCNSIKGTRTLFEWYPNYKCYSKEREQKIYKYLGYKTNNNKLQLQLF